MHGHNRATSAWGNLSWSAACDLTAHREWQLTATYLMQVYVLCREWQLAQARQRRVVGRSAVSSFSLLMFITTRAVRVVSEHRVVHRNAKWFNPTGDTCTLCRDRVVDKHRSLRNAEDATSGGMADECSPILSRPCPLGIPAKPNGTWKRLRRNVWWGRKSLSKAGVAARAQPQWTSSRGKARVRQKSLDKSASWTCYTACLMHVRIS